MSDCKALRNGLLGLLLALTKRACPKQAAPTVKETADR